MASTPGPGHRGAVSLGKGAEISLNKRKGGPSRRYGRSRRAPGGAVGGRRAKPAKPAKPAGAAPFAPVLSEVEGSRSGDSRLLRRWRAGDEQAFDEVFRKYRDPLHRLASRSTQNREEALEIVQEVFVRAFEGLPRFRGGANLYGWLRRIAGNLCIDRARARKGIGTGVEFDENIYGTGKGDAVPRPRRMSPVEGAEFRELSVALREAVGDLTEKHRQVFLLHAEQGLSYREIAAMVGCSIGTVMSRLHYARKELQKLLRSYLA